MFGLPPAGAAFVFLLIMMVLIVAMSGRDDPRPPRVLPDSKVIGLQFGKLT